MTRTSTEPSTSPRIGRRGAFLVLLSLVTTLAGVAPAGAAAQPRPEGTRPAVTPTPDPATGASELTPDQRMAVEALSDRSGAPVSAVADADTGQVTALVAQEGRSLAGSAGGPTASAVAFVDAQRELLGAPGDLDPGASGPTLGNGSSVRFAQSIDGVPVLGGEVAVTLDAANRPTAVVADVLPDADISTVPDLTSTDASPLAIEATLSAHPGAAGLALSPAELNVYNPVLLGDPGLPIARLVWKFEVTDTAGTVRELVLVDAHHGSIALQVDEIAEARERSVCDRANVRGAENTCSHPSDRDEGDPASGNTQVDLAYDFSGDTYDFFSDSFGRDSIDDNGFPLVSNVNFCATSGPCPYPNAFWNGEQLHYGSGFASADDVVAHELSHGVTEHTSNLLYWYESGAISEAMSDIFGELIDQQNSAGNDDPGVRWRIGEDLPGGTVRSMSHPPTYGDPDRMTSASYWDDATDNGGVHTNSGVANKAAFLMTDGGTFNGVTVTALGAPKTAAIWYETNATLLTSGADYADLDIALVAACHNLIGTVGITAANCTEVSDATDATEMHLRPALAGQQNEAPVCTAGRVPTYHFDDDLENVSSGNWTTSSSVWSMDWYYPASSYWGTSYATSGTESAAVPMFATHPGEASFAMTEDYLVPPASFTFFRFARAYEFDSYGGMVVEYSTNGGTGWTDAGPLLSHNGYTGTLNSPGNPLDGRPAFTGTTRGYSSTRANLSSLAGSSVRFRFRTGNATFGESIGAFVDDVQIYTCAFSSTLAVNSTGDTVDVAPGNGVCADAGAQCSLRAAVQEANALAGPNTITLPTAAHFTLTRAGAGEDQAATGDLDVRNGPITINGNDSVIDGNGLDRVLNVHQTGFTARDLTITGGNVGSHGGGVLSISSTPIILDNVNVSGNTTTAQGGGIFAAGELVIDGGRIAGNASTNSGGGMVMLGELDLDGTTVENNTSGRDGGGLYLVGPGPMAVANATVIDNTTSRHAGGVYIDAPYTVTDSTISANAAGAGAGFGGGLGVGSVGSVTRTTLADNTAYLGGGFMALGAITVTHTTLSNNTAAGGGGAALAGPSATIANSTISGNTATIFGGGGILNTSTLGFSSSTLTANNNGGLFTVGVGEFGLPGGTSAVANTIIANQAAGANCTGLGSVVSGGRNVTSTVGCSFTGSGDQQNVNPLLEPLADNGGPTRTHNLQVGSPAIGTAYPSCPATDQRGIARPLGGTCDSGAVELVGTTADLNLVVDSTLDEIDADPGDLLCASTAGHCTLRAAIMEANAVEGDHVVTLQGGTTYPLARGGKNEDQSKAGDLDIRADITIVAAGSGATIDINDLDRVLEVHSPSIVVVQNVAIVDGTASHPPELGGGIYVRQGADLTLMSAHVIDNVSAWGGGIYNQGTLTVGAGSSIDNNIASWSGGGLVNDGTATIIGAGTAVTDNSAPSGAGIENEPGRSLQISGGVEVDGNVAADNGGGLLNHGTTTITSSVISGNRAGYSGGTNKRGAGFENTSGATLTIVGSQITGNIAGTGFEGTGYGGGGSNNGTLHVQDGTSFADNVAGEGSARGDGGNLSSGGTTNITDAVVTAGTADNGAGLYVAAGSLSTLRTTISNNSGAGGGGLFLNDGTATIDESIMSGNTVTGYGGAALNWGGTLVLDDSTLSANTAEAGGGIMTLAATTVTDSTVTLNTATNGVGNGGAIYVYTNGVATLGNSIVSANTANHDCGGPGTFTSTGYNYAGSTCALAGTGDVAGSMPNLGSLADNGGLTLTHLPNLGSPVIGSGNPACAGTDQRGLARPQGGSCDKGAVDR